MISLLKWCPRKKCFNPCEKRVVPWRVTLSCNINILNRIEMITIDPNLEWQNFKYKGWVIAEIWNVSVINIHPEEARYLKSDSHNIPNYKNEKMDSGTCPAITLFVSNFEMSRFKLLWFVLVFLSRYRQRPLSTSTNSCKVNKHCMKYVQIQSFFWSLFFCLRTRKNSVFRYFWPSDKID